MEDCYEKWQLVFLMAASIHIFDIVFYLIFASGELQDWAKESQDQEETLGRNDEKNVEDKITGLARHSTYDTMTD